MFFYLFINVFEAVHSAEFIMHETKKTIIGEGRENIIYINLNKQDYRKLGWNQQQMIKQSAE